MYYIKNLMIKTSLCILLFSGCKLFNSENKNTVKSVDKDSLDAAGIVFKFPSLYSKDSIELVTDSSFIYSFKNYKIIETLSTEYHFLNDSLLYNAPRSNYYGYSTTKSKGFNIWEAGDSLDFKEQPVDSFLKGRPYSDTAHKMLAYCKFYKDTVLSPERFIKKYVFLIDKMDSLYLYFQRNYQESSFSFSTELEKEYTAKLYRIEVILKKDSSEKAQLLNKYRKLSWELFTPNSVNNREKILKYIGLITKIYDKSGDQ